VEHDRRFDRWRFKRVGTIRNLLKRFAFGVAFLLVSPLALLSWCEKRLSKSDILFTMIAQSLALIPGIIGSYLRSAFYVTALEGSSWEIYMGFGSYFSDRGASLEPCVYIGAYCILGTVTMDEGATVASRVSIPSGKRQHLDDKGNFTSTPRFDRVRIGAKTWIGEGAIVLADVGSSCIISAGAVVLKEIPEGCLAGGNPAKIIKQLSPASSGRGST
jgi:acetyltransferase-like isoleucine patch superfamily enzyme